MYPPTTDTELAGLIGYYDQQLAAIRAAPLGLTDAQCRTTPCRSALSIGGIVKHTAYGMRGATTTVSHEGRVEITADAYAAHAASFALTEDETMTETLAEFDEARAAVLTAMADADPDADFLAPPSPWFGIHEARPARLRYFLVHQIEETARHAGHADIIREQLDGVMVPALQLTVEGMTASSFFTPYEPAPGTIGG